MEEDKVRWWYRTNAPRCEDVVYKVLLVGEVVLEEFRVEVEVAGPRFSLIDSCWDKAHC